MERWDEAVAASQRCIALHPDNHTSRVQLGIAFSKLERWTEAADEYRQAIELSPDDSGLHKSLGTILLRSQHGTEAAAAFRRAVSLDPDDAEASARLNAALTKLASAGFKERTLASYAVGDNALFIRTEKHLYRVQRK